MTLRKFISYDSSSGSFIESHDSDDTIPAVDGITMGGTVTMQSNKVTGMGDPASPNDALGHSKPANLAGLSLTGNLDMSSSYKITNLGTGTESTDLITKAQLDSLVTGNIWHDPVSVLKMVDDSLTTSPSGVHGNAYVVAGTGGDWSSFNVGDIVEYQTDTWVEIIDGSGGSEPPDGTRVIVIDSSAAGSFSGQENKIGEYDATANSWSFTTPTTGVTVFVTDDDSVYDGDGYVYDGSSWIRFSGLALVTAGDGLTKSSNTISLNMGNGVSYSSGLIYDLGSDKGLTADTSGLAIDPATNGGIVASAGIALDLETDGGLEIGASGLEIEDNFSSSYNYFEMDSSGLRLIGVGSSYEINEAGPCTVTAAQYDALTDGSTLAYGVYHDHSAANHGYKALQLSTGVGAESPHCKESGGVSEGDPIAPDGSSGLAKARADTAVKSWVVGVAGGNYALDADMNVIMWGLAAGILSSATAGDKYYVAETGGLTTTMPAAGNYVTVVGYAINATDFWVSPQYYGIRNS